MENQETTPTGDEIETRSISPENLLSDESVAQVSTEVTADEISPTAEESLTIPTSGADQFPLAQKQSKKNTGLWIGLGLVLLLVVLLGGGYLLLQNQENNAYEAGQMALISGDAVAAKTHFETALSIQPAFIRQHDVEATADLGIALYLLGERDASQTRLEEAASLGSAEPVLPAYQALVLFESGENQAAAERVEDLNIEDLGLPQGVYIKLMSYLAAHQFGQQKIMDGIRSSDIAFEFPELVPVSLLPGLHASRAEYYFSEGMTDEGIDSAKNALTFQDQLSPEILTNLLLNQAEAFLAQKDNDSALAAARSALALDPTLALPNAIEALAAFYARDFDRAIQFSNTALENKPEQPLALAVRGSVHAYHHQLPEAVADLDRALLLDPDNHFARVYRMMVAETEGDYFGITAMAGKLPTPEQTDDPFIFWAHSMVASFEHKNSESLALIAQAIERESERPEFYCSLVSFYWLESQEPQKDEALAKTLELDPEYPCAIFKQAEQAMEEYDFETLESSGQHLVDIAPNYVSGYLVLGALAIEQYDYVKAREYFSQALAIDPDSPWVLRSFSWLAYLEDDLDSAIGYVEEATNTIPTYLTALALLAGIQQDQENTDLALETAEKIIDLSPESSLGYNVKSFILSYTDDLEQAQAIAEEGLAINPGGPDLLYALYRVQYLRNQPSSKLIATLDKILEADPFYFSAHNQLGYLYLQEGAVESVAEEAEKSMAINPYNPDALYLLGLVAAAEGEHEKSVEHFTQSLAYNDENPYTHQDLGWSYFVIGENDKAISSLETAIELEPEFWLAYNKLAYINHQSGNIERAIELLSIVLEKAEDIEMINSLEGYYSFLKSIPPLVNGLRTHQNTAPGYSLSYGSQWIQSSPDSENVDLYLEMGSVILLGTIEVIAFENDGSVISSEYFADALIEIFSQANSTYVVVARDEFTFAAGQGTVVEYTVNDEQDIHGKNYLYVSSEHVISIMLETTDEDYAALALAADAVAKSLTLLP